MQVDTQALEHAIEEIVDVNTAIEVDGESIVVTGFANTPEEREAVLNVLERFLPDIPVQDNIELAGAMPETIGDLQVSEAEAAGVPGAEPGLRETESLEPGDFTDQSLLNDQDVASGPSGTHADDDVAEGDEVYIPPTDPVSTREGEFLGGFQTTSDEPEPVPGTEVAGGSADGAIEEAVRAELLQDAATTALDIEVTSVQGTVRLRGIVDDIEDAENAQAVAERVPGVMEVLEELEVRAGQQGG